MYLALPLISSLLRYGKAHALVFRLRTRAPGYLVRGSEVDVPVMFKCWVEDSPLAAIVHVQGDVDLLTAHEFRECVRKTATSNTHNGYVIVDMSKLEYIDGRGLWVLAEGHQLCRQHNRELVLVAPSAHIERILGIVNLTGSLPVLNSVEALSVHVQLNGDHPEKSGEENVTTRPPAATQIGIGASGGESGEA